MRGFKAIIYGGRLIPALILFAGQSIGHAASGSPVKFSGTNIFFPDEPAVKPWEKRLNQEPFSGNIRQPSEVPFVPAASSSPTMLRNPALRKLIDQRQNWIFASPDVQNATTEEMIGERDNGPDKLSAERPKKTVERYFDASSGAKEQANNPARLDFLGNTNRANSSFSTGVPGSFQDSMDSRSAISQSRSSSSSLGSTFEKSRLLDVRAPLLGGLPGGIDSKFESSMAPSLDFSTGLRSDPGRQAELRRREEFRQMIQPGRAAGANGMADPINLWPDASRRELQPVTASTLDEVTGEKTRRNFLSGIPTPDDAYRTARPDFLEELNSKVLGKESFANPLTAIPSPVESFRPKTAVFEMPKRRF